MFHRSWKSNMTGDQRRRGWVFFALYLFVFPRLNSWAQRVLMGDGESMAAEANVVYYTFLFAISLLAFWGFWKGDFQDLLDWMPENLFGILVGLLGAGALHLLVRRLPFPVRDPIPMQYAAEYAMAPKATLLLILLLIPVVEELLFRALVFGSLRSYSRPLAYLVSIPLYALCAVWRYALESGDARYLLLAVLYLPMSAALTWCYDNGGSVWATAVLHGGINAVILFTA